MQPVRAWLQEELSGGLQVGDTHVLALPEGLGQGVSTQESEDVLLEGLSWLAQHAQQPSQPPVNPSISHCCLAFPCAVVGHACSLILLATPATRS